MPALTYSSGGRGDQCSPADRGARAGNRTSSARAWAQRSSAGSWPRCTAEACARACDGGGSWLRDERTQQRQQAAAEARLLCSATCWPYYRRAVGAPARQRMCDRRKVDGMVGSLTRRACRWRADDRRAPAPCASRASRTRRTVRERADAARWALANGPAFHTPHARTIVVAYGLFVWGAQALWTSSCEWIHV